MEPGRTNLTEAVRSVQLLKIDGYCATAAMDRSECIKSRWSVDGHDWEVHLYPAYYRGDPHCYYCVALKLILLGGPQRKKWANLKCQFVDPSGNHDPSQERRVSYKFQSPGECPNPVFLMERSMVPSSGYLVNDSLTVKCTLTVLKELPDVGQHGADVTLVLDSGDCFPAHKSILAVRSPVFMAEFFGHMNERSSQSVRIEDMQAAVFRAMLHFIYTDTAPELDEEPETAAVMAQHLLAAADRYGLDRLKLICEGRLSGGIDADTAAATLTLAEQHGCSLLKARCVEFIVRSPERLDAILATEGYKHLSASCPLVLAELLKAARGRKN